MAASLTVPQVSARDNSPLAASLVPRRGVLTLFGYGIRVQLERGHLVVEDGIGPRRRRASLPRIGHGLKRLIVIGSDGMISLAAIRWLADQKAAFVMLNRNGSVLLATGQPGPRDARLRRAQALASVSGIAEVVTRDLIDRKLVGQERNIRHLFNDKEAAAVVAKMRQRLSTADTIRDLRLLEAQAALVYWGCWRALRVTFPTADLPRVPRHWRTFGARMSPLTSSPRLSVNPPNAMLNYLYAVLESEARLAAAALGLDPSLGLMHMDAPARDNLACDLMEPVRPLVDEYVLNWLLHQPLKREWFFEERNGTCRLMGSFVERLSATAPTWAQMIGPIAERIAQALWATVPTSVRRAGSGTPLTQRRRREANGVGLARIPLPPRPPRLCQLCGAPLTDGVHCAPCAARLRGDSTQRKLAREESARNRSDYAPWLTREVFIDRIQPRLREKTTAEVASLLGVSKWYAMDIRLGRCCPHQRHFQALATLTGVAPTDPKSAP